MAAPSEVSRKRLASHTSPPLAISVPAPKQTRTITSVTTGPAIAIRNSCPGVSVSRCIRAMPPNIHRSMPTIGMPLRSATIAWPSSWSRIERKNSSAETTASTNAFESSPGKSPS